MICEILNIQETAAEELLQLAQEYIDEEKGVATAEEALAGANDIIAEMISDDADIRRTALYVNRHVRRFYPKVTNLFFSIFKRDLVSRQALKSL